MGAEVIRACLYDKLRDTQKEEIDRLMADAPAGRPQVRGDAHAWGQRGSSRRARGGRPHAGCRSVALSVPLP
jgi:hypothetical protein